MTGITVNGLPSSRKTPGTYMSVILGGPGSGSSTASERLMLVGNYLASALTGATPSFSVTAGTATVAVPTEVFSEQDSIDKFGQGCELHRMCASAFAQDPNVPLWATPCAEGAAAVKASSTLALTGTVPSADLTIVISCGGVRIEFGISASETIDNLGTAIAQAILDSPNMPITAQINTTTDVITFTAKQGGTRGNNIPVRIDITTGTRTYKLRTGALAATVAGTIFTLSAERLASGSVTESTTFATAVTALAPERWHRIAVCVEDSTNIAVMANQCTTKAGVTQMLWEQCIAGNVKDLTTSTTGAKDVAAALNNPRAQLVWHYNSDRSPGEIAAQVAAARLMGDSFLGGTTVGETSDPATNLDGCLLATIGTQELATDKPLPTELETALNYGVTPLVESGARPGYTEIVRSITCRFRDSLSALNYSVLDTTEVTVPDYTAEFIRNAIQVDFKGCKAGNDSATGEPPKIEKVVTPSMLKSYIAGQLRVLEERGIIHRVTEHMSQLAVVRDAVARGRFNAEIPCEPIPGFHLFGGNVRQLTS